MRAYLKTWRYNIETTVSYHGSKIELPESLNAMVVTCPVLDVEDGAEGVLTYVTIVSGDEVTITLCPRSCEAHKADEDSVR